MNTPDDQIPRRGVTRDVLLNLNNARGQSITQHTPGEVITDVDGIPTGVAEATTTVGTLAGVTVALHEIEAAGLTAADVPNVTVIDVKGTQ